MSKKKIEVSIKLLKDIYDLITESGKIDWDDHITTRLYKVLKKEGIEI